MCHSVHRVRVASQYASQVSWPASRGVGFPACITGHMTRVGLHPGEGRSASRGWGSASRGRGGLHSRVGGGLGRPPRSTWSGKAGGTHPTGMPHCSLPPANVVCEGYVFTRVCHSVHKGGGGVLSQYALQVVYQHTLQQVSGGGWYPSMPCRFPGPHPVGKLRGIWVGGLQAHTQGGSWGYLRSTPRGVSRPTPVGCLSQHALRQNPPPRWLLLRAVRILLECILVSFCELKSFNLKELYLNKTYLFYNA